MVCDEENELAAGDGEEAGVMLYWFELKKIVKRKMVWITLLVSIVVGIFTVSSEAIGDFYMEGEKTDTNYHKLQMDG